jgi:hypothetical protein
MQRPVLLIAHLKQQLGCDVEIFLAQPLLQHDLVAHPTAHPAANEAAVRSVGASALAQDTRNSEVQGATDSNRLGAAVQCVAVSVNVVATEPCTIARSAATP